MLSANVHYWQRNKLTKINRRHERANAFINFIYLKSQASNFKYYKSAQRVLLVDNAYAQIKLPHKIGIDSNIVKEILAKGVDLHKKKNLS